MMGAGGAGWRLQKHMSLPLTGGELGGELGRKLSENPVLLARGFPSHRAK